MKFSIIGQENGKALMHVIPLIEVTACTGLTVYLPSTKLLSLSWSILGTMVMTTCIIHDVL